MEEGWSQEGAFHVLKIFVNTFFMVKGEILWLILK